MQSNQIPANDSEIQYPSATAVLIDNDDTTILPDPPAPAAGYRNQFASAHVVGNGDSKVSPFSSRLIEATETHATATALDPWSKEPTVTTTESNNTESNNNNNNNNSYTPTYQPPGPVDAPAGHTASQLSSALYEDPLQKKYRRRRRRRARMAVGGVSAFVVGSVLLGPFGAIAFGCVAAGMARSASKSGERRKDKRVRRRLERQMQQNQERVVVVQI